MNGRVYDADIGRFLQADPHIQAPKNSQNFNRYSYVLNNPMSYTDPSGYFFKKLVSGLMKITGTTRFLRAVAKVPILNGIIQVGLAFVPGCQTGICHALYNGAQSFALTGSLSAGIKAGLISYASAQLSGAVGDKFAAGTFENALGNALVGGVTSELQGGKFGHGFFAAGLTAGLKGKNGDFGIGTSADLKPFRVMIAAVVGGTASVITGGKFANGAVTGAMTQLFNAEKHIMDEDNNMVENPLTGEKEKIWKGMQPVKDSEGRLLLDSNNEIVQMDSMSVMDLQIYGENAVNLQCQAMQECLGGLKQLSTEAPLTNVGKPKLPANATPTRVKLMGDGWYMLKPRVSIFFDAANTYRHVVFQCGGSPEVFVACGGTP